MSEVDCRWTTDSAAPLQGASPRQLLLFVEIKGPSLARIAYFAQDKLFLLELDARELDTLGKLGERFGLGAALFERAGMKRRDLALLNRAINSITRFLILAGLLNWLLILADDLIKSGAFWKILTAFTKLCSSFRLSFGPLVDLGEATTD